MSDVETLILVRADGRVESVAEPGLGRSLGEALTRGLARSRSDGRAASPALTRLGFLLRAEPEVVAEVAQRSTTSEVGRKGDSDNEPHALCVRDVLRLIGDLGVVSFSDRAVRLAAGQWPLHGLQGSDRRWLFRPSDASEYARQVAQRKRARSA